MIFFGTTGDYMFATLQEGLSENVNRKQETKTRSR